MTNTIIKLLFISLLISIIFNYANIILNNSYFDSDFRSFFSAAQITQKEPQDLYSYQAQTEYQHRLNPAIKNPNKQSGLIPFANPPFFLIPYILVSSLSPQAAYQTIIALNFFVLTTCLLLLNKTFSHSKHKLIILLLVLSFSQTYITLLQTQSSFLTLLLFTAIYLLIKRQKWFLTGLTSSILLYKPQLGLILYIYLALQKKPKILAGFLTGSIILFFISWFITNGHPFSILLAIRQFIDHPGTTPINRISWLGFFTQIKYFIPAIPAKELAYFVSLITIIYTFKIIKKTKISPKNFPLTYSLLIVVTLLSVIHVHGQELVLLFFPLHYFFSTPQYSNKILYSTITIWFLLLFFNFSPFYPNPPFFYVTIILLIIYIFVIKKLKLTSPHNANH